MCCHNEPYHQVVFASQAIDTTGGSAYGGHIEIIDLLGEPGGVLGGSSQLVSG